MEKAPILKELLQHREENYATSIVVSTKNDKDLFKGNISDVPEKLLNLQIFCMG